MLVSSKNMKVKKGYENRRPVEAVVTLERKMNIKNVDSTLLEVEECQNRSYRSHSNKGMLWRW